MTAPFPPPRRPGLRQLAPEMLRIVEALARVREERDHRAAANSSTTEDDAPRRDLRPL